MSPVYSLPFHFTQLEAVNANDATHGSSVDPLSWDVVVTPGEVHCTQRRLATGLWLVEFAEPATAGQLTLTHLFTTIPQVYRQTVQTIDFAPVRLAPPGTCTLYGTIENAVGAPIPGAQVRAEVRLDPDAAETRVAVIDMCTDIFGHWQIPIAVGYVVRIIPPMGHPFQVQVPDLRRVDAGQLPLWMASTLDGLGNPAP